MSSTQSVVWPGKFALLLAMLFIPAFSQASLGQSTKGSGGKACPAHWKTHACQEGIILCVDPKVEMENDFEAPFHRVGCNPTVARDVILNSSIRGDPYLHGFAVGSGLPGFWMQALMLDSSMVQDGDVERALRRLGVDARADNSTALPMERGHILGTQEMSAWLRMPTMPKMDVNTEGKAACPVSSSAHVCGSMILLCVAPQVERENDLPDSQVFQEAYCDARPLSDPVPATAITGDAYKAGFSLGFRILAPRFVDVIKLDSPQMAGGNLDEALRKLNLRIPSDWETKFDEGVDAGARALIDAADQAEAKAKQIAK